MDLAISIPQLIILIMFFAVPLVAYRIVRKGEPTDLARPLAFLTGSFVGLAGVHIDTALERGR